MTEKLLEEVGWKCKAEIKTMCSLQSNSLLKDRGEALSNFSWDVLWNEFKKKCPYLVKIVKCLLSQRHQNNRILICFVLSLVVKSHNQQMAFLQRVISVFLYGKGVGKKVWP